MVPKRESTEGLCTAGIPSVIPYKSFQKAMSLQTDSPRCLTENSMTALPVDIKVTVTHNFLAQGLFQETAMSSGLLV